MVDRADECATATHCRLCLFVCLHVRSGISVAHYGTTTTSSLVAAAPQVYLVFGIPWLSSTVTLLLSCNLPPQPRATRHGTPPPRLAAHPQHSIVLKHNSVVT